MWWSLLRRKKKSLGIIEKGKKKKNRGEKGDRNTCTSFVKGASLGCKLASSYLGICARGNVIIAITAAEEVGLKCCKHGWKSCAKKVYRSFYWAMNRVGHIDFDDDDASDSEMSASIEHFADKARKGKRKYKDDRKKPRVHGHVPQANRHDSHEGAEGLPPRHTPGLNEGYFFSNGGPERPRHDTWY